MIGLLILVALSVSEKSFTRLDGTAISFSGRVLPVNLTSNAFDKDACEQRCSEEYSSDATKEATCKGICTGFNATGQTIACTTFCSSPTAPEGCEDICAVAVGSNSEDSTDGDSGSSMSDDEKDCRERCDDKLDGDYKQFRESCYAACHAKQGKCPADGYSDCKDKMKKSDSDGEESRANHGANGFDKDTYIEKMCSAICPRSLWWVFLIVGIVVVAAVVAVVIVILYCKKLACFKGATSSASVAPSETVAVDTTSEPPSSD